MARMMQSAWVVLMALAFVAAPYVQANGDTALLAEKQNCLADAEVTADVLSYSDCGDCVEDVKIGNRWACGAQLCQNADLWSDYTSPTVLDMPTALDGGCVECLTENDADICMSCYNTVPFTINKVPYFFGADVAAARDQCITCATSGAPSEWDGSAYASTYDIPGWKDQGARNSYFWACGICSNLPFGSEEQQWCYTCISSTYMQVEPVGIATYWDYKMADDWPRLNDFGACAIRANQTFAVNQEFDNPVGIYAMCVVDDVTVTDATGTVTTFSPELSQSDCVACIKSAQNYTNPDPNPDGRPDGNQPENSTKAYACASTCRDPVLIPAGSSTVNGVQLSEVCTNCVIDPNVYDAWGCTNCIKQLKGQDDHLEACLDCVRTSPYQDKIGTYNWACAECSAIEDPSIRALCLECISYPALELSSNPDLLFNDIWVGDASVIICECVDMSKTSTWTGEGDVFDPAVTEWYTEGCPNCTALQTSCYRRKNVTLSHTPESNITYVVVEGDADGFPLPEGYRYPDCTEVQSLTVADLDPFGINPTSFSDGCYVKGGSISYDGSVLVVDCDAQAPRQIRSAAEGGVECALATNLPGWHLIHIEDYLPPYRGYAQWCAQCVINFDTAEFLTGARGSAYACERYCNDPYTIFTPEESFQCFQCLYLKSSNNIYENRNAPFNRNVASCEQCMQAFNHGDDRGAVVELRSQCMDCLLWKTQPQWQENFDWACIECTRIADPVARSRCFECLSEQTIDPCQCVDGAKAGWLFYCPATCLEKVAVQTAFDEKDLFGGPRTADGPVLVKSREECAEIANRHGAKLFGLHRTDTPIQIDGIDVFETECYWFLNNLEYFDSIDIDLGDCPFDADCPIRSYDAEPVGGLRTDRNYRELFDRQPSAGYPGQSPNMPDYTIRNEYGFPSVGQLNIAGVGLGDPINREEGGGCGGNGGILVFKISDDSCDEDVAPVGCAVGSVACGNICQAPGVCCAVTQCCAAEQPCGPSVVAGGTFVCVDDICCNSDESCCVHNAGCDLATTDAFATTNVDIKCVDPDGDGQGTCCDADMYCCVAGTRCTLQETGTFGDIACVEKEDGTGICCDSSTTCCSLGQGCTNQNDFGDLICDSTQVPTQCCLTNGVDGTCNCAPSTTCCSSPQPCDTDTELNGFVCSNSVCCEDGEIGCGNGCIADDGQSCCPATTCCTEEQPCTVGSTGNGATLACTGVPEAAGDINGRCCPSGETWCKSNGGNCVATNECCPATNCCSQDQGCVSGTTAPFGGIVCVGNTCCDTTTTCCAAGNACSDDTFNDGSFVCLDSICCDTSTTCCVEKQTCTASAGFDTAALECDSTVTPARCCPPGEEFCPGTGGQAGQCQAPGFCCQKDGNCCPDTHCCAAGQGCGGFDFNKDQLKCVNGKCCDKETECCFSGQTCTADNGANGPGILICAENSEGEKRCCEEIDDTGSCDEICDPSKECCAEEAVCVDDTFDNEDLGLKCSFGVCCKGTDEGCDGKCQASDNTGSCCKERECCDDKDSCSGPSYSNDKYDCNLVRGSADSYKCCDKGETYCPESKDCKSNGDCCKTTSCCGEGQSCTGPSFEWTGLTETLVCTSGRCCPVGEEWCSSAHKCFDPVGVSAERK
mmetsp:Transcript_4043/g.11561  ORF Transcript_4043/g.11561 Transcript_4043/m.11561 type:complete len:1622 (-) Transcript_4043:1480-6345(-)